ncbi:MAG: PadR family transcriptional regulator [Acidimicrobiales bacterium]
MRKFDTHWDHRRHAFGDWGGHVPPFPGWGPGRGRGRRRGGRGRRGDVRAAVLGLLAERPMHGYEIIQELDSRTGGLWRPSPGSVYPTLQMLEDEGLIVSQQSDGRRRFTLTDAGGEEAARAAESAPWSRFADEDEINTANDFRMAGFGLMKALWEVGSAGTDDQRQRALEILNETRRKLYAVLAETDA